MKNIQKKPTQKLGNKEIEAGILNNLGGVYYMQGKYKDALEIFQQAFELVGYGQSDLQKQTRNTSFINMAYAYSELENYKKAFEYQDKFFSLNSFLLKISLIQTILSSLCKSSNEITLLIKNFVFIISFTLLY